MAVCQSASYLKFNYSKSAGEACWGFKRQQYVVSIFTSPHVLFTFYLFLPTSMPSRAHAVHRASQLQREESISSTAVAAQSQLCMCVQWLHPFSLPHKIYKSSRHIKGVLGS